MSVYTFSFDRYFLLYFAFVDEDILASYLCKKKNFINNRIKEFINNRVINRNNIKITGIIPLYYGFSHNY